MDRTVDLPPLKGPKDLTRTIILTVMVVAILGMLVRAVAGGGENRYWAIGWVVVVVVGGLLLVRRFRIEWVDGVPSLVSRTLLGLERRIVLDHSAAAEVKSRMGYTWVGVEHRGRRIWVQVMSKDTVWNAEAPPVARDAEQMTALADAVSGCAGGRQVAHRIHAHLDALARGVPVEKSPLWHGAAQTR